MGVYSIHSGIVPADLPVGRVNTPVPFRAYDGKCWVVENRTRNGHEANVYVCIASRRGQWSGVFDFKRLFPT